MKYPPILLKSISQKDNHTFSIEWSDGVLQDFHLGQLQQMCPCAKCLDEKNKKVNSVRSEGFEQVRAVRVTNVGRYALRIQFTSGCSKGIYSFAMLREIHARSVKKGDSSE